MNENLEARVRALPIGHKRRLVERLRAFAETRTDWRAHDRLAAIVVRRGDAALDDEDLRRYCRQRLPTQSIPQVIIERKELPRTPAGKIDRVALRDLDPVDAGPPGLATVAGPRSATEATLAGIWEEVLGLDRVGVDDDFFEVGGDSLLVIRILSRMARAGLRIGPDDFLDHPTIAAQVGIIDEISSGP